MIYAMVIVRRPAEYLTRPSHQTRDLRLHDAHHSFIHRDAVHSRTGGAHRRCGGAHRTPDPFTQREGLKGGRRGESSPLNAQHRAHIR